MCLGGAPRFGGWLGMGLGEGSCHQMVRWGRTPLVLPKWLVHERSERRVLVRRVDCGLYPLGHCLGRPAAIERAALAVRAVLKPMDRRVAGSFELLASLWVASAVNRNHLGRDRIVFRNLGEFRLQGLAVPAPAIRSPN